MVCRDIHTITIQKLEITDGEDELVSNPVKMQSGGVNLNTDMANEYRRQIELKKQELLDKRLACTYD